MGVLQLLWSILKLIFLSLVIGTALTGILTKPMLRLPDQMALAGIESDSSSSSAFSTSTGVLNLAISAKRFFDAKVFWVDNFSKNLFYPISWELAGLRLGYT
jgi:hypothetical protein